MRITVWNEKQKTIYECHEGETLYDTFVRCGTEFYGACGGNGRCLKCRIRVRKGEIPITIADKKAFSSEELEKGFRLACKAKPNSDCEIEMHYANSTDKAFAVISDFKKPKNSGHDHGDMKNIRQNSSCDSQESYLIAVDIGTTTIAMQLGLIMRKDNTETESEEYRMVKTYSSLNPQIKYGTDIMARIRSSINGEKEQLTYLIRKELKKGLETLIQENDPGFSQDNIKAIVITGNTTMLHILMGYPLDKLGVYPFEPVSLRAEKVAYSKLFGTKRREDTTEYNDTKRCESATEYNGVTVNDKVTVFVMPGISAFVGADIMAGLLALQLNKSDKITMLVDLGTNGEMVIGNRKRLVCTSTAAGPAFEGGNMKWGLGSVSGAICSVDIRNSRNEITTIDHKKPIGICGTGIVEAIAEFIRADIMDDTGLMKEPYFTEGYTLADTENGEKIQIIQKDIREFQMAKAAIAAGIKTLIRCYGISCKEIDTVYLAGGFGWQINIEKAVRTGLIPKELKDKIVTVGNSALHGAFLYGISEINKSGHNPKVILNYDTDECRQITQIAEEMNLAEDSFFQNQYIEEMNFNFCE